MAEAQTFAKQVFFFYNYELSLGNIFLSFFGRFSFPISVFFCFSGVFFRSLFRCFFYFPFSGVFFTFPFQVFLLSLFQVVHQIEERKERRAAREVWERNISEMFK